jgi:hypothetical protein
MQIRLFKIFLPFLVLAGFSNTVLAQLKFTAKISPSTIGKDETFELKLLVENARNVEQITPPPLGSFTIISGPNQESGMESINGSTREYSGITFILQPKAKGDFIIASAKAKADGKTMSSNPVTIKVVNGSTGNGNPNSPFNGLLQFDEPVPEPQFNDFILKKNENVQDKINKNIFIRTEANKTSCYVGEPIVVTYKLYTRLKSESNIVKNPSLNGFSVIDLMLPGSSILPSVEKLNGRAYNVYVLRKAQLYPLQAGDVELESAEVENNIHFVKEQFINQRNKMDDILQGFAQPSIPAEVMVNETITLQSKPVIIHVKPLPDTGKPASFNGAVGNFSIEAAVEKNSFTTDDAGKLTITISGSGNITLVTVPELIWPAGIEVFDPATKENLDKFTVPVSGRKTIEYPFTVTAAGDYTLPVLAFSFFDVAAGKYRVIYTKPIAINVAKGIHKKSVLQNSGIDKPGKEKFFDSVFGNRWIIILPIGALIFIGLVWWLKNERKKEAVANKQYMAEQVAEKKATEQCTPPISLNPLAGSEHRLTQQDTKRFYETINKELKSFLASKLQLHAEATNRKNIADALDKTNLPLSSSLQLQQLLDEIEWELYTPFADTGKMQDVYERANRAVHMIDKAMA